jgi:hypothetical protein
MHVTCTHIKLDAASNTAPSMLLGLNGVHDGMGESHGSKLSNRVKTV